MFIYLAVQFCYCLLKITLQKVTPADSENAKVLNSVPHSRHTIRAERTVDFSKENHCAVTLMQQQKRRESHGFRIFDRNIIV